MRGFWLLAPVLLTALAVTSAFTGPASGTPDVRNPLLRPDVVAAVRAWHDDYRAAVLSGHPDRLVATGDAYRRIGHFAGRHEPFDAKAREIYLAALFRARQQESFDGVLVAGEAFAALGDREMVQQVMRMAQALAGRDAERQADVRVFAARVADRAALHGVPRPE